MKSICIISPIAAPISDKDVKTTMKDGAVRTHRVYLPSAPASIECAYDAARAAAPVAEAARRAEEDGYDAVVVDCFADPGVAAARELVSIPVCGAGETSMLTSAALAGTFAVVTVLDSLVPIIRDAARRIGLSHRLTSVLSIGVPVQKLPGVDLGTPVSEQALRAVDDGAGAVVLGCTGLVGVGEVAETRLRERTGRYVPVIDASVIPVLYASMLIDSGLSHSELHYPSPAPKPMDGMIQT